ncbi:response regulator [Roseobacter sp. CCS2]|uniref:response regulator n=1 Tax=Roseobacter sp. CCS2 TaxID=391593 RepID=UPI0000F40478|nr:response regulator [Roseobacter sp. CCS2]EBA13044.1 response regulator [Roseobacter sp. CCS2]
METLDGLMFTRAPTARRPLLGLTVLVVEDSRFASEAVRLMCLRSGARIRRADSLENARRHLAIYRPTVLLVDVGLPDGSGLSLIRTATEATPRIEVVLGMSGEDHNADVVAAGADGFVTKPVQSLLAFQTAILEHLPKDRQPPSPRSVNDETIRPDLIAYRDDLNHIAQVLDDTNDDGALDYVTQFLSGVARSAHDHDLDAAVENLSKLRRAGDNPDAGVVALTQLVQTRIAASGPL